MVFTTKICDFYNTWIFSFYQIDTKLQTHKLIAAAFEFLILFTTILDDCRPAIYVVMEKEYVKCLERAHVKVKVALHFHGMDCKFEWFVCSYSWPPVIIDCNIKCKG